MKYWTMKWKQYPFHFSNQKSKANISQLLHTFLVHQSTVFPIGVQMVFLMHFSVPEMYGSKRFMTGNYRDICASLSLLIFDIKLL